VVLLLIYTNAQSQSRTLCVMILYVTKVNKRLPYWPIFHFQPKQFTAQCLKSSMNMKGHCPNNLHLLWWVIVLCIFVGGCVGVCTGLHSIVTLVSLLALNRTKGTQTAQPLGAGAMICL